MRRALCSSLLVAMLCCAMNPASAHAGDVVTRLRFDHGPTFLAANGSHAHVTLGTRNYLVQQIWGREAAICSHGLLEEASTWPD